MANKYLDIVQTNIYKNKLTIPLSSVNLSGNTKYEINIPSNTITSDLDVTIPTSSIFFTTSIRPPVFSTSVNYTSAPGYSSNISTPYVKYVSDPIIKISEGHAIDGWEPEIELIQIKFYMSESMITTSGGNSLDIVVYNMEDDSQSLANGSINDNAVQINIPIIEPSQYTGTQFHDITQGQFYLNLTDPAYFWFVDTNLLTNVNNVRITDISALQAVFKDYPKYIFTYNG